MIFDIHFVQTDFFMTMWYTKKVVSHIRALARNCAVDKVSEDGGDAGDDWRRGKPVRVVRSCKMMKHFPKYAPQEGIR